MMVSTCTCTCTLYMCNVHVHVVLAYSIMDSTSCRRKCTMLLYSVHVHAIGSRKYPTDLERINFELRIPNESPQSEL